MGEMLYQPFVGTLAGGVTADSDTLLHFRSYLEVLKFT